MTATATPPPPPSSPAPIVSPPSAPPPAVATSLVWASLILDIAALGAILLLAKWHLLPSEVTAAAFFSVITGRVVAKASRNGGPPGAGGIATIGGVFAIAHGVYAVLYRGGHA